MNTGIDRLPHHTLCLFFKIRKFHPAPGGSVILRNHVLERVGIGKLLPPPEMIDGSIGIGEQQRRMIVDSYRIDEHVRHFPLIAALAQPCACQSGFRIILMIGVIYGKEQIHMCIRDRV